MLEGPGSWPPGAVPCMASRKTRCDAAVRKAYVRAREERLTQVKALGVDPEELRGLREILEKPEDLAKGSEACAPYGVLGPDDIAAEVLKLQATGTRTG